MLQHDITPCLCHLIIAIIPCVFRMERQSVSLAHLDVSVSLETVALLIEIGTVTGQRSALMTE